MGIRATGERVKGTTRVSYGDRQLMKRLWIADRTSRHEQSRNTRQLTRLDKLAASHTPLRRSRKSFLQFRKQCHPPLKRYELRTDDDIVAVDAMLTSQWFEVTNRFKRWQTERSWLTAPAHHAAAPAAHASASSSDAPSGGAGALGDLAQSVGAGAEAGGAVPSKTTTPSRRGGTKKSSHLSSSVTTAAAPLSEATADPASSPPTPAASRHGPAGTTAVVHDMNSVYEMMESVAPSSSSSSVDSTQPEGAHVDGGRASDTWEPSERLSRKQVQNETGRLMRSVIALHDARVDETLVPLLYARRQRLQHYYQRLSQERALLNQSLDRWQSSGGLVSAHARPASGGGGNSFLLPSSPDRRRVPSSYSDNVPHYDFAHRPCDTGILGSDRAAEASARQLVLQPEFLDLQGSSVLHSRRFVDHVGVVGPLSPPPALCPSDTTGDNDGSGIDVAESARDDPLPLVGLSQTGITIESADDDGSVPPTPNMEMRMRQRRRFAERAQMDADGSTPRSTSHTPLGADALQRTPHEQPSSGSGLLASAKKTLDTPSPMLSRRADPRSGGRDGTEGADGGGGGGELSPLITGGGRGRADQNEGASTSRSSSTRNSGGGGSSGGTTNVPQRVLVTFRHAQEVQRHAHVWTHCQRCRQPVHTCDAVTIVSVYTDDVACYHPACCDEHNAMKQQQRLRERTEHGVHVDVDLLDRPFSWPIGGGSNAVVSQSSSEAAIAAAAKQKKIARDALWTTSRAQREAAALPHRRRPDGEQSAGMVIKKSPADTEGGVAAQPSRPAAACSDPNRCVWCCLGRAHPVPRPTATANGNGNAAAVFASL